MAFQIRRGTDAQRLTLVLADGEPFWTTDTDSYYIGDGTTAGGIAVTGSFEAHTIASHSDTSATGPELDTLTNGSNADSLHTHAAISPVEDTIYSSGWNGDTTHSPSQNAVYDKINSMDVLISGNTNKIISDLNDVYISVPGNYDILSYRSVAPTGWINRTIAELGLAALSGPLTGKRLVYTDEESNLITSTNVTDTEAEYLNGVTSNIQDQIDTNISGIALNTAKVSCTTENVTSAGALMDSEVDANIKTLALPASTTISVFASTILDDEDAAAVRETIGVDAAGTDNSKTVYKKIVYLEPPAADDEYPILSVPFSCTITRITHITDTGTVDWNLEERAEATPFTAGTDVYSSDEQSSSTNSVDTSFNNASLAAHSFLYYVASAVASDPTKLMIAITYEED